LGSDVQLNGNPLKALPTRDAILPTIMLLAAASDVVISALVSALPQRFTHSGRIQNFAAMRQYLKLSKGIKKCQKIKLH
jgi:phosphomannomutase